MSRGSSQNLQGSKGRDVGLKGTNLKVEPLLGGEEDGRTTLRHVPQMDLELAAKCHWALASKIG